MSGTSRQGPKGGLREWGAGEGSPLTHKRAAGVSCIVHCYEVGGWSENEKTILGGGGGVKRRRYGGTSTTLRVVSVEVRNNFCGGHEK